jgi:hypothetical protein
VSDGIEIERDADGTPLCPFHGRRLTVLPPTCARDGWAWRCDAIDRAEDGGDEEGDAAQPCGFMIFAPGGVDEDAADLETPG